MSQYPPNPNYNPYGQNAPDPNNPGTAYGGPPSGPNPNPYNPYPNNPSMPGTNPNPYGPYEQNPPTPTPPPYDPYSQTVVNPNTNYNPYVPPPPPVQPRRGPSIRVILISVIALVLVLGGIIIGLASYNNAKQSNANATATAQANVTATAHANATATFNTELTATAIASTFPFSANLVLSDPLSDNSKNNGWQTNSDCKFQAGAYHVLDESANTFNPCAAVKTDFQNFTFQVEGILNKGDGIGITFRGNADKNQIYRFTVFTDNSYNLVAYVDPTGTNARLLTSGSITPTPTLSNTNTFAVVARGSSLGLYFNQTLVTTFNDPTYAHGQIGVEVDNGTATADAVFTNAQVWKLS